MDLKYALRSRSPDIFHRNNLHSLLLVLIVSQVKKKSSSGHAIQLSFTTSLAGKHFEPQGDSTEKKIFY